MQDFKNIRVWKSAHDFVIEIYKVTKDFPRNEIFGITSQIRRSSFSIANNIAEGSARSTDKEFAQFISYSIASASETEYLLILSGSLNYINNEIQHELTFKVNSIRQKLIALHKVLK